MNTVTAAIDKKTMIHVAAELVILSGVTFWLNSKINSRDERIAKLEKENKELKMRLERIETFLAQMTGRAPPPNRPPPSHPPSDPGTNSGEDEEIMSSSDEEIEI